MTPEKEVQNAIIKYLVKLEKQGYPVYHERRQAGGYSYKMGIPDLYAIFNGQHVEIEVKAPGKELRPMQVKWQKRCNQLNIHYVCADTVETVEKAFCNWFSIDS